MADPKLGTKRQCPNCAARFYDLNKRPNECPKCEHVFEPEVILKPRKPRMTDKPKEAPRPAVVAEAEEEEAEDEEDEEAEEEEAEDDAEDEAEEIEAGEEVETELVGDPISDEEVDDETDADGPKGPKTGKGRRGTTEAVDPDLEEFDEAEIEVDDDEEEDDDTLLEDEEGEDDLSDIVEPGKDD